MKAWILLMLALTLPMAAQAEEAKEGEAPKVSYISLSPPFVGNYGLDGTAKLKVFKADIALRVTGTEAAAAVKANDALIRNQLVALFTQQTNETMSTVEGKEKLRQSRQHRVSTPGTPSWLECHRAMPRDRPHLSTRLFRFLPLRRTFTWLREARRRFHKAFGRTFSPINCFRMTLACHISRLQHMGAARWTLNYNSKEWVVG